MLPISIQAAQRKESVIYSDFLQENPSYTWFRTLDINKDGVKELIVSKKQLEFSANVYYCIYNKKELKLFMLEKYHIREHLRTEKAKSFFIIPN